MFLAAREEVETALTAALQSLDFPTDDLGIEQPPADVDAIIASSVAYRLAGEANAPPPAVANDLKQAIAEEELTYISTVESAGPYLNFFPSERYFTATLDAAQDDTYGKHPSRDTSVVVEHTSANPTGPVHVGRARNPIIGDAIARILDYAGYDVETHYYVNDAGRQIATFTWAYETFDESELPAPDRDKPDYRLVRYYRKGNDFLENGPEEAVAAAEDEIQAIMQGLENGDEETYRRVAEVVDTVLDGMQETLQRLPATFDRFIKETKFIRNGATNDIIDRLKNTEQAQRTDDGAWELDLSEAGFDKNLVFVRSDGTSLYTTRDLAHHEWKLDTFDRAVTVLGEDHKLQARQLGTALELLGVDTDRLDSIHYSWVNLPNATMSTREGTGIDLDDLLDEAIDRAREEVETRIGDRGRGDTLTEEDIDRIARQVGVGAVRYDIVAKQPLKQITFEWDRALDFEAQSAPYIQYAHARCSGILDEATNAGVTPPATIDTADDLAPETAALLETIARFPAVIDTAAADLEPHAVATYARELADAFNAFYRECPVLDAPADRQEIRLGTVIAAKQTLANALGVLGVAAPERM